MSAAHDRQPGPPEPRTEPYFLVRPTDGAEVHGLPRPVPRRVPHRVTCWLVINGVLTGNRMSCCISSPSPQMRTTLLSVLLVILRLGAIVLIILMIKMYQSRDRHMPQGFPGLTGLIQT